MDLLTDEGPNPLMQGAVGTISMNAEQQQGRFYQRLLFEESAESPRHGEGSEGGTQPSPREEQQADPAPGKAVCRVPAANDPARALTERLMEEVTDRENLNRAYRQVKGEPRGCGRLRLAHLENRHTTIVRFRISLPPTDRYQQTPSERGGTWQGRRVR